MTPSSTSCATWPSTATNFLLDLEQRERERTGIADAQGQLQPRARLLHRAGPQPRDKVPPDYQRRQT
jgi:hypothetical protein